MAKNAGICDGRKYQTANINCSGQTTVTTGVQPCELVATGFRDNRENRIQVSWEPVKIESVSGASLKKKNKKDKHGRKSIHEHCIYPQEEAKTLLALRKTSILVLLGKAEVSVLGSKATLEG